MSKEEGTGGLGQSTCPVFINQEHRSCTAWQKVWELASSRMLFADCTSLQPAGSSGVCLHPPSPHSSATPSSGAGFKWKELESLSTGASPLIATALNLLSPAPA